MSELADRKHLLQRNGVWYYRRRVPDHMRETLGKKFIQHSLNTKSIKDAIKSRNAFDVRFDMEFEEIEPNVDQSGLPNPEFSVRLTKYVNEKVLRFETRYINDAPENRNQIEGIVADKETELQILSDPAHPLRHQWVESAAVQLTGGQRIDGLTSLEVDEAVRRSLIEALTREVALLREDFKASASLMSDRTPAVTFKQIAEQYLILARSKATANNRRPQWVEKVAQQVGLLIEVLGEERHVSKIDYDACLYVQGVLGRLPAHRDKRYRGLPLEDVLDKVGKNGAQLLSPTTQAEYLNCFKSILQLATDKALLPNNPAANIGPIKLDQRSADERRASFTNEQIAKFFASSFYQSWGVGVEKPYSNSDRDWRFWLPLLMTFSGMRPGEICQLQTKDICRSLEGVLYADVNTTGDSDEPFAAEKKLKTSPSKRLIPIHPQLIALGFDKFVGSRRGAGKEGRLFRALSASRRGYYSDYPCRRFRENFLPAAIDMKPNQSFYSFRHSFRDALRRMDAPDDVVAALGGWSEGTKVSNNYGNPRDPDYLSKYINKVEYPGLQLDFAYTPLS